MPGVYKLESSLEHALKTALFSGNPVCMCPCCALALSTHHKHHNHNKGGPERNHRGSWRDRVGHDVDQADLPAVHHHARPHRSLRVPHLDGGADVSHVVVRFDVQVLQVRYRVNRVWFSDALFFFR